MFDKFKEFIGIDDNYDDYDEDQAYYEEEEEEDLTNRESYASLLDDNKSSFDSNIKTYESEYSGSSSSDSYNYSSDYLGNNYSSNDYEPTSNRYQRPSKRGDRAGSMTDNNFTSRSSLRISIQEPLDYEQDAPSVINDIINKKVVVLNLEMVDADMRRRIFDFVSGAVYALDGTVEKVTKGIFVITPNGVEIDNTVTEQISEGNYNQL